MSEPDDVTKIRGMERVESLGLKDFSVNKFRI
jgi:hypothetical protein